MIKEALEYFAGIAQSSAKPIRLNEDGERAEVYLVGEKIIKHNIDLPPRSHRVESAQHLADWAVNAKDSETAPTIWVNDVSAVLVMDTDGMRLDCVTLRLDSTDVFKTVSSLNDTKPWHQQKPFARMLRIELASALAPGILLDKIRRMKFESGHIVTSEATKNRESMGKQITSQVSGEGEIPETVTLEVGVFRGWSKFSVACSVDVDPERGLLQLAPLPDEIDRVTRLAVHEVYTTIRELTDPEIPVFLGRP